METLNELESKVEAKRVIIDIKGKDPGPTLVVTAGIHGNEPSGVLAARRLRMMLENIPIKGHLMVLGGNIDALAKGQRFSEVDLNRIWKEDRIREIERGTFSPSNQDEAEQLEIYQLIRDLLQKDDGPFFFVDLHSTSSDTIPFIVVNDSLKNRAFTEQYPLPLVLGIEEYLEGALLSYINELGYIAFGFEGGQHDDLVSVENHLSFLLLTLVYAGMISKEDFDFDRCFNALAKNTVNRQKFYEIFYQFKLKDEDQFVMTPGYVNFQHIEKGKKLATFNGKVIQADQDAMIFMPLYQDQGSEGFFAIREVSPRFLRLSRWLRLKRWDHLLTYLPGVQWQDKERSTLRVNRRVARFFTKQIFHFFGYRARKFDQDHYLMKNREYNSRVYPQIKI